MDSPKSTMKESQASSPKVTKPSEKQRAETSKTSIGGKLSIRSEIPTAPLDMDQMYTMPAGDIPAAGNQNYAIELKEQNRLVEMIDRPKTQVTPTPVELLVEPLYDGFRRTLRDVLIRALRLKRDLNETEILDRSESMSATLAKGCCLMTFLKVRALVLTDVYSYCTPIELRRPRAPKDIPIPSAFAFAIQQLGTVNVADLTKQKIFAPCFPKDGHKYGIPTSEVWDTHAYAEAVEYARTLGIPFTMVDLKVKNGSAWWLLEQSYLEEVFELVCILPESNYTESMVLAHMLFLNGSDPDPSNAFVDLTPVKGVHTYGTMLQSPHVGMNVSCFQALSDTASEVWTNV